MLRICLYCKNVPNSPPKWFCRLAFWSEMNGPAWCFIPCQHLVLSLFWIWAILIVIYIIDYISLVSQFVLPDDTKCGISLHTCPVIRIYMNLYFFFGICYSPYTWFNWCGSNSSKVLESSYSWMMVFFFCDRVFLCNPHEPSLISF